MARGWWFALLETDDGGRAAPKTFEVVELPLFLAEQVNDYIAVVQQHPT
jgi:hypothetical protein